MTMLPNVLRAAAIVIAVLGFIDPVRSRSTVDRPLVGVIDAGAADETARVSSALSQRFDVHNGAIAGAAGTVVVGAHLPSAPPVVSGALVAAVPAPAARAVKIQRVIVPETALPSSRIPVAVTLQARGVKGRTLRIDVVAGGVLLDRATAVVHADDESIDVNVSAVGLTPGLARIAVRVRDDQADDAAMADETIAATVVKPERWDVLVVDARPSWLSTFVRRAIEGDRRFAVASRVSTSRGIVAEAGKAPALTDASALEKYSVVIVGAPDALAADEVRTLERYARSRGGSVVLLADRTDSGPFAALTGTASWRDVHGTERRALSAPSGVMVATELLEPVALSPLADVLAKGKDDKPAVWQVPLGAGRVVVNGALDAWRYRTREQNGFNKFWADAVGSAAAAAPPALSVEPARRVAAANTPVDVKVIVRAIQLSDAARPSAIVDVKATIAGVDPASAVQPLRLWPTPERGVFVGALPPQSTAGTYRVDAEAFAADGASLGASSSDVLIADARTAGAAADVTAWTTAHGGTVIGSTDASAIETALRAGQKADAAPRAVHPMRSVWWLPVFVAVLGTEWWLRRRRGDR